MTADPQHGVLCHWTWRLPDGIISFDRELSQQEADEIKARFIAAGGSRRVEIAPPLPELTPPAACPECGHSGLVHVGVDHCPVCELIWQSTPDWHARQARMQGWHPRTVMAR